MRFSGVLLAASAADSMLSLASFRTMLMASVILQTIPYNITSATNSKIIARMGSSRSSMNASTLAWDTKGIINTIIYYTEAGSGLRPICQFQQRLSPLLISSRIRQLVGTRISVIKVAKRTPHARLTPMGSTNWA